jgi:hypothetical protein
MGFHPDAGRLEFGGRAVASADWSPAVSAAAMLLQGFSLPVNFLPPYVSPFRRVLSRFSARRTLYTGGAIGALFLAVALAFGIQGLILARLESRWSAMDPRVKHAEDVQGKIRAFRPWFEESAPSLRILRQIAAAFPVDGSIWVKSLQVKDLSQVTCSANARSNRDWLAVLEALRKIPGVSDLQVSQVRGDAPLQFTLSFKWTEDAAHAR